MCLRSRGVHPKNVFSGARSGLGLVGLGLILRFRTTPNVGTCHSFAIDDALSGERYSEPYSSGTLVVVVEGLAFSDTPSPIGKPGGKTRQLLHPSSSTAYEQTTPTRATTSRARGRIENSQKSPRLKNFCKCNECPYSRLLSLPGADYLSQSG